LIASVHRGYFVLNCTMARLYGFPGAEKLKSRSLITGLFSKGSSFSVYPIRVTWMQVADQGQPFMQAGVSASKRNFKKAVDRNRLKRLLREAYRLQKNELMDALQASGKHIVVFFLFTGKELASFEEINQSMSRALKMLQKKINEKPE
jgi:ribonuclease P protein component